jgi:hypothetical protein
VSANVVPIVVLGVVLCVAAAAILIVVLRTEETKRVERRAARRRDPVLDEFYAASLRPLTYVDIAVKKDEVFYFAGVADWEARRVGAGQLDTPRMGGMLYVSNQRFAFVGSGIDERMEFGAWQSASVHPDAIQLKFRKNTITIYCDDPLLGPIFTRVGKKQFDALHPKR